MNVSESWLTMFFENIRNSRVNIGKVRRSIDNTKNPSLREKVQESITVLVKLHFSSLPVMETRLKRTL